MVTEWGWKSYREDVKRLQMGWEETLFVEARGSFFEVHSCFKTVRPIRKAVAAPR